MYDVLITSGCSCSVTDPGYKFTNWPIHLTNCLGVPNISSARIAQSNGMISRGLLYDIEQARLQGRRPLVAVTWSSIDRHEVYASEAHPQQHQISFVKNGWGRWVLMNPHWDDELTKLYYTRFHDGAGSMISTLEHMLRVQWYLKQNEIDYWMATYTSNVIAEHFRDHPDVEHLLTQIDFDQFLPVSLLDWAQTCGVDFDADDVYHLNTQQNTKFTYEVILPFMKEKGYV